METLTLEKLKEMEPGIFAEGTGTYPELYNGPIRWVASRGGIWDWALYYHRVEQSAEWVKNYGAKAFTKSVIRKLVPCDDEAWEMYR